MADRLQYQQKAVPPLQPTSPLSWYRPASEPVRKFPQFPAIALITVVGGGIGLTAPPVPFNQPTYPDFARAAQRANPPSIFSGYLGTTVITAQDSPPLAWTPKYPDFARAAKRAQPASLFGGGIGAPTSLPPLTWQPQYPDTAPIARHNHLPSVFGGSIGVPSAVAPAVPPLTWQPEYPDFAPRAQRNHLPSLFGGGLGSPTSNLAPAVVPSVASYSPVYPPTVRAASRNSMPSFQAWLSEVRSTPPFGWYMQQPMPNLDKSRVYLGEWFRNQNKPIAPSEAAKEPLRIQWCVQHPEPLQIQSRSVREPLEIKISPFPPANPAKEDILVSMWYKPLEEPSRRPGPNVGDSFFWNPFTPPETRPVPDIWFFPQWYAPLSEPVRSPRPNCGESVTWLHFPQTAGKVDKLQPIPPVAVEIRPPALWLRAVSQYSVLVEFNVPNPFGGSDVACDSTADTGADLSCAGTPDAGADATCPGTPDTGGDLACS